MPSRIAKAAALAQSEPLKLSGAQRIFMLPGIEACRIDNGKLQERQILPPPVGKETPGVEKSACTDIASPAMRAPTARE
jgi:hypothetical protein